MSTLQAVIFGTSEQRPTFVARKNPGSGWGVDILWPDGETEVIKGFITEHDAAKWIAEHSAAGELRHRFCLFADQRRAVTDLLQKRRQSRMFWRQANAVL
jgi:hypothetical protein